MVRSQQRVGLPSAELGLHPEDGRYLLAGEPVADLDQGSLEICREKRLLSEQFRVQVVLRAPPGCDEAKIGGEQRFVE